MSNLTHQAMRFCQLDKILELEHGKRILAQRTVQPGESILRDHFPLFAVLPGVLMLEALYQASCWLIRKTSDFECGVLMMAEAKNVKFADFALPGETLQLECTLIKSEDGRHSLKCQGTKGESIAVSARLVIAETEFATLGDPHKLHNSFIAAAAKEQFSQLFSEA